MKKPYHVKGLDISIRENDYLFFYMDIVNHRNLKSKEFFEYINDKYGNNYRIMQKIEYLSYNISSYKADKLRIIMEYKKAELDNKFEKVKKLENDFKKIKNVEIEQYNGSNNKNLIKTNAELKSLVNIDETMGNLGKILDDYLNDKIDLSSEKLTNLNNKLLKYFSQIGYEKYVDFVIKRKKVKIVNQIDINEDIEVLEYFIKNLNNNLYKIEFCDYIIKEKKKEITSYDKEINHLMKKKELCENEIESQINALIVLRDEANKVLNFYTDVVYGIHVDEEDKLDTSITSSISKLIIWKCQKMRTYLNNYKKALNYLNNFKNEISNDDGNLLNVSKIYLSEIKEESIREIINDISKILNVYKSISSASIADSKLGDVKHDYLRKVYKNN